MHGPQKQGGLSYPVSFYIDVDYNFITMAAKGTASKSASGASMSQYDVEVEKRLKIIEARLAEIEVKIFELSNHEHEASSQLDDNKKLDVLWRMVEMMEPNFEKLAKSLGS